MDTAKPAPAYASALRTAWEKSLNVRCMWKVPSLMRSRTVGLGECEPRAISETPGALGQVGWPGHPRAEAPGRGGGAAGRGRTGRRELPRRAGPVSRPAGPRGRPD